MNGMTHTPTTGGNSDLPIKIGGNPLGGFQKLLSGGRRKRKGKSGKRKSSRKSKRSRKSRKSRGSRK